MTRDAIRHGVRIGGLCEEGLEVVLDERIERRLGGTAAPVDGPLSSVPWADGVDAIEG